MKSRIYRQTLVLILVAHLFDSVALTPPLPFTRFYVRSRDGERLCRGKPFSPPSGGNTIAPHLHAFRTQANNCRGRISHGFCEPCLLPPTILVFFVACFFNFANIYVAHRGDWTGVESRPTWLLSNTLWCRRFENTMCPRQTLALLISPGREVLRQRDIRGQLRRSCAQRC